MPLPAEELRKGNAHEDGAPCNGWFVAGFIDPAGGLRARAGRQVLAGAGQADFELKLKRHPAGDGEPNLFPFNRTATSFSMLVGSGRFELYFCSGGAWDHAVLERDGDYALWGPGVGHLWFAPTAATIFTVRVPGIPGDQAQTPLDRVPPELRRRCADRDLVGRERRRAGADRGGPPAGGMAP